jgi:hypothetical protein
MRAFPVRMPSGVQYWTVIDSDLRVVPAADASLRHLRFGRDAADSTTKAYAGAVVLYLSWCAATGQDWRSAVELLPSFVLWLRYAPSTSGAAAGAAVRGPRRINCVLAGTRIYDHTKHHGAAPAGPPTAGSPPRTCFSIAPFPEVGRAATTLRKQQHRHHADGIRTLYRVVRECLTNDWRGPGSGTPTSRNDRRRGSRSSDRTRRARTGTCSPHAIRRAIIGC